MTIWTQIAPGQLDFQFLAQDFQIQEGGSQDFLIQNVSGSTVWSVYKLCKGYQQLTKVAASKKTF